MRRYHVSILLLCGILWGAFAIESASAFRLTPLLPLPAPKIINSAEVYPGGNYVVEHLVDGREKSQYASHNRGTDTFVDFDFGKPVLFRAFQHVDRHDVATVAEAELLFSDSPDFGDILAREVIHHANIPGGLTTAVFEMSHRARYVRWKATKMNAKGYSCLGGSEIRFFTPGDADAGTLRRDKLRVRAVQAIERREEYARRPIEIQVEHVYAESLEVLVKIDNLRPIPLELKFGRQTIKTLLPVRKQSETLSVSIELSGRRMLHTEVEVVPVRHWELHFLPHSHVDIGYTHVQTEVERKQWEYLRQAIEIARKTADYPPEARFKWNTEILWAVDSYLRQAPDDEKKAFLDAVRRGVIHLDGLYGNELTALCSPEELMRLTSCARRIARKHGLLIDSAMISDVPGYTWGVVPALVQSGIKYLSIGPNHIHRIGLTLEQWGDKPFYWVSPSGQERLLCWMAGKAYSWFHGSRVGTLNADSSAEPFFEYLDELLAKKYPYELVQIRYSIGGDNGPPDQQLSEFVKAWNEKYEWPRMVISTTRSLMHALEDRYGDKLPEVRGDFTPYWEDGAASSARETAITRRAAQRLAQAETLCAMRARKTYPVEPFYLAWRNVLLYDEHTWGAHCSISQPDSPFTLSQWKIKQTFALDAERQSRDLLNRALPAEEGEDDARIDAVDVWNTCSWPRSDLVRLKTDRELVGYIVKDLEGNLVPATRTRRGQLVFMARDVPPFAAKRFLLEPGLPEVTGEAKADQHVLSNERLRVEIDPDTGAISSLRRDGIPVDLVDNHGRRGLNRYSYVAGRHATVPGSSRVEKIEVVQQGGVAASLVIYGKAPGVKQLLTIVRVVSGLDRVDIINMIDKEEVRSKESVHLGFPFQVPDGVMRVNTPWAVVVPESDQLPGACKNYLTVGRWVDISNNDFGVTWFTRDAPLIEVGGIHVDVPSPVAMDGWIRHLEPTQTFYSYVMNNYWETNYKASQEGVTVFRYAILPHGEFDQAAAARFALDRSRPLFARPAKRDAKVLGSCMTVDGRGVVVTSLKPSDDGQALMIRLFNAGSDATTATLHWSAHLTPKRVTLSSPREEVGKPITKPISMPPLGIVTLRADQFAD